MYERWFTLVVCFLFWQLYAFRYQSVFVWFSGNMYLKTAILCAATADGAAAQVADIYIRFTLKHNGAKSEWLEMVDILVFPLGIPLANNPSYFPFRLCSYPSINPLPQCAFYFIPPLSTPLLSFYFFTFVFLILLLLILLGQRRNYQPSNPHLDYHQTTNENYQDKDKDIVIKKITSYFI